MFTFSNILPEFLYKINLEGRQISTKSNFFMKVRVDMKTLLKLIYRYFKSKQLRIRGVIVSPLAHFNRTSKFEGVNVVHRGAVVSGSEIGYGTYIGENSILGNCRIGKYCSIAGNVKVVASTHPTRNFVSTSPMFFSTLKQNGKTYCERNKFNEHLLVQGRSAVIGNDGTVTRMMLIT